MYNVVDHAQKLDDDFLPKSIHLMTNPKQGADVFHVFSLFHGDIHAEGTVTGRRQLASCIQPSRCRCSAKTSSPDCARGFELAPIAPGPYR